MEYWELDTWNGILGSGILGCGMLGCGILRSGILGCGMLGSGMLLVQTSSPVEEVVCNLGVDDHAPLTGQDLIEGRDAVGNHLSILVLQHLV